MSLEAFLLHYISLFLLIAVIFVDPPSLSLRVLCLNDLSSYDI